MSEFDALDAPAVRAWRKGFTTPPGLLETVAHWVGIDRVLVTLRFVWPVFARVEGCVLLPWEYSPETFSGWREALSGDRNAIESAVNHLHLWDVFDSTLVSESQLEVVGEALRESWMAALAVQAPTRKFDVRFSSAEDDFGPTVSIISL